MRTLRAHQQPAIDAYERTMPKRSLIVMPTGTGKTFVGAEIIRRFFAGKNVLWIALSRDLINQANKELQGAAYCETDKTVHSQLLQDGYRGYDDVDLLVIDEAHHGAANYIRDIVQEIAPKHILGLTATPIRADGLGLQHLFDEITYHYPMERAIKEGQVAEPIIEEIQLGIDFPKLRSRVQDFNIKELNEIMNTDYVNNMVVDRALTCEFPAIGFAVNCSHAQNLHKLSLERGMRSAYVDGQTPTKEREAILKSTDWDILWNVAVCTEGVDIPRLRTGIIVRPTGSDALYTQMVGRAMRPKGTPPDAGKCYIIDFRGNASKIEPCRIPTILGIPSAPEGMANTPYIGSLMSQIVPNIQREYASIDCVLKNRTIMKEWASTLHVKTRDILFIRLVNGDLYQPMLNRILPMGGLQTAEQKQSRIDEAHSELIKNHSDKAPLWKLSKARGWHNNGISEKQAKVLWWFADRDSLNQGQASMLIDLYIRKLINIKDGSLVINTTRRI